MVFEGILCDSKSPLVSRTLFIILAHRNNALVCMVCSCPLISKFSSSYIKPLEIVPSAPITNGITVTFMFHIFFSSQASSCNKSLISQFFSVVCWDSKIYYSIGSLFCWLSLGLVVRWSICISKWQRSVCVSFSWTDSVLCIYYVCVWPNFTFLHTS